MNGFAQFEYYDWDNKLDYNIEHEETYHYGGQSQLYDSNIQNKVKLMNIN